MVGTNKAEVFFNFEMEKMKVKMKLYPNDIYGFILKDIYGLFTRSNSH